MERSWAHVYIYSIMGMSVSERRRDHVNVLEKTIAMFLCCTYSRVGFLVGFRVGLRVGFFLLSISPIIRRPTEDDGCSSTGERE